MFSKATISFPGVQRNNTISRSSAEKEFRSLVSLVVEISWLQSLLGELNAFIFQITSSVV